MEQPFALLDPDRTTLEMLRLAGRAVMLTRESDEAEDVQINFTTLLIAFLVSDDALSRWFRQYVGSAGIHVDRIYTSKSIGLDALNQIRASENPERGLTQVSRVSSSTNRILRRALDFTLLAAGYPSELARQTGGAAQQSAQYGDEPSMLDVRHVMGAYIYDPGIHEEQLLAWGFDQQAWGNAFFQALAQLYPDRLDELAAWRDIHRQVFGSPPTPPFALNERLIDYDADWSTGHRADDLLNITPDVNALAALIAAKNTVPSLAIGVFGDWGSGKTFFMRSLMRRIDELTAAARGGAGQPELPQKEITFYKRIVQIEFNAWHYVEGNLWASLVEHILKNLRISQDENWDPDGRRLDTLQAHLIAEIKRAEAEEELAEQQVQAARDRLSAAAIELQRLEREREARQRELGTLTVWDVLDDVDREPVMEQINGALEAAGLPQAGQGLYEIKAALTEGRALLQRGGALAAPLMRAHDKRKRVWLLFVSLVAGPVVGFLASLAGWWVTRESGQEFLARVSGIALGSATLLGSVANWLRSQFKWVSDRLDALDRANQRLETLQATKLAVYDQKIAQIKADVKDLDRQYVEAQEWVNAARREVQEIEEELRQATPARRLARFIEERTDSDDYRKHLGLLALVRRDFEVLSAYIEGQNALLDGFGSLDEERENAELRINRIVLYIDDLDRCPAEKVVQVLQAVHLLLAFPLFVVVVGVDARWVSRALEEHYPHLRVESVRVGAGGDPLGFGRAATPHDYLEKIFQIPIWLLPIGERGSRQMLDGLLRDKAVAETLPRAAPSVSSLPGDAETEFEPSSPSEEQDLLDSAAAPPLSEPTTEETEPEAEGLPIDLTPDSLEVLSVELEFMKELAGVVGRSPRAVKRFVNLYRLIKATLEQTDDPLMIETIAGGPGAGDHEAVLFLLAVVAGLPDVSRQFFEAIHEGQELNEEYEGEGALPAPNLAWALKEVGEEMTCAAAVDCECLSDWLNAFRNGEWLQVPLRCFAKRAAQVARYSFRVEQR